MDDKPFSDILSYFRDEKYNHAFLTKYYILLTKGKTDAEVLAKYGNLAAKLDKDVLNKILSLSTEKKLSIFKQYLYNLNPLSDYLKIKKCNKSGKGDDLKCEKAEVCDIDLGLCTDKDDSVPVKIDGVEVIGSQDAISKLKQILEPTPFYDEELFKQSSPKIQSPPKQVIRPVSPPKQAPVAIPIRRRNVSKPKEGEIVQDRRRRVEDPNIHLENYSKLYKNILSKEQYEASTKDVEERIRRKEKQEQEIEEKRQERLRQKTDSQVRELPENEDILSLVKGMSKPQQEIAKCLGLF